MSISKAAILAAVLVSAAPLLAGCGASHDLSIAESCKQWHQLAKIGQDQATVNQDLKLAEPRMHETVAKQVRAYVTSIHDGKAGSMSDDDVDTFYYAVTRLDSICGPR